LIGDKLKEIVARRNPGKKPKNIDKILRQTLDFVTYGTMAVIGLYCVNGYYGVPKELGGSGTCTTVGWEWPRPKFHTGMRIYSFVQHGYHLQSKFLQAINFQLKIAFFLKFYSKSDNFRHSCSLADQEKSQQFHRYGSPPHLHYALCQLRLFHQL
jgi:hypothetical protein